MIEKVNPNSACFERLYTTKIGQKSRIGHVFKHNVYNAIYDLQKCPFTPKINESSKQRKNVFKNSDRLYNDGQRWIENRETRKKEENDRLFKPRITEYSFKDLWEKPGQGERLGIELSSRKTKYYDEEKFSPYRFKKAYLRGDFDEFYDCGEEGFRPQEKLNIILHELPKLENGPIDENDTAMYSSTLRGKSKEPKSALKSTRAKLEESVVDGGVSDMKIQEQIQELNDLKKRTRFGKDTSRSKSSKSSKEKSKKSSKKSSKLNSKSRTPLKKSKRESKKVSKSVTPQNEKISKGKKMKKTLKKGSKNTKKKSNKVKDDKPKEIIFDDGSQFIYKKKEPELIYVDKTKKNHVNNIPRDGKEKYFINIVQHYAVKKEGGFTPIEGSKSPKRKKRAAKAKQRRKKDLFKF